MSVDLIAFHPFNTKSSVTTVLDSSGSTPVMQFICLETTVLSYFEMNLSSWWLTVCKSTSVVSLRNVLLRDCPGKWWFVTQRHARRKSQEKVRDLTHVSLCTVGVYMALHCFVSQNVGVFWRVIYNTFVTNSGSLETLIHNRGLNKVKCGCCRQHSFIWQWLISLRACWRLHWWVVL